MGDWIYLKHADAGETRVPDQPGVLESYQARGWSVMDDPELEAQVFVPPKVVEKNERDGWVTLYHPETHAVHEFPSHPDAVQGAYESGWQASPPKVSGTDPADPVDNSEKAPVKRAAAKKATEDPAPADPATDEGE
jgi:hypothetical protein